MTRTVRMNHTARSVSARAFRMESARLFGALLFWFFGFSFTLFPI